MGGASSICNEKYQCLMEIKQMLEDKKHFEEYSFNIKYVPVKDNGDINWEIFKKGFSDNIDIIEYNKSFLQFVLTHIIETDSGNDLLSYDLVLNLEIDEVDYEILERYIYHCVKSQNWGFRGDKMYSLPDDRKKSHKNNIRIFERFALLVDIGRVKFDMESFKQSLDENIVNHNILKKHICNRKF